VFINISSDFVTNEVKNKIDYLSARLVLPCSLFWTRNRRKRHLDLFLSVVNVHTST